MTTAIDNPYCTHPTPCDECAPPPAHECYFCGAPADTWVEERDESVGYAAKLYYCEKCEDKIY